jgi:zinc protease
MRNFVLASLLVAAPALAAGPVAPKANGMAAQVKQWQLPNGLKVIFVPDHKAPVVSVQVFYHVGGKDEPADKRGMAHMFEHMMFKGSRHVPPEEHARFIDAVGGNENAFTEDDVTAYHDTVPPAALDFTLQLEAERVRNLELTQKTIDSERQVVIEELRMRLENSPISKAVDKLLHLAYTTHPYMQEAIGEKKMLETVTVEDCKKFYDKYYQPNNATLIVVGDTDEQTLRGLIDKHFGPIKAGAEPPRPAAALKEPEQKELRQATMAMPVQLPIVIGGYHIPAGDSPDLFPLAVLERILSGGESSRMFQRLVRKDKTAVVAGGALMEHEDPGLFLIYALFLPGSDSAKIRAALEDEIAKVVAQPVSPKELQKAKNQLAAQAVRTREKAEMLATQIGLDSIAFKDPLRVFSAAAKFDAVTAADVQRVAKKYLQPTNESVVVLQALGQKAPPPQPAPAKGGAQ